MSQCPVIDIAQKETWARRATTASIVIAATLILIKAVGWFLTDSVSLLSSMIDSMLDVGTSVINFMAVRSAWRPADYDHRFGHGKAEPLAGLHLLHRLDDPFRGQQVQPSELIVRAEIAPIRAFRPVHPPSRHRFLHPGYAASWPGGA